MRILIIEDDIQLCQTLAYRLKKEGIHADHCHDGREGLNLARENVHELILLDRMLPSLSGTEVLKRLRSEGNSTPVILVTALGEVKERVQGLDCGADDYLVKPIAFEELMARIRSIGRRPRFIDRGEKLHYRDLFFDVNAKVLSCGETSCRLSRTEGNLMEVFLKNPGQVLARKILVNKVWGIDTEIEDGNLDNFIHFLRRRLKSVGSCLSIRTIRGVGYSLEE